MRIAVLGFGNIVNNQYSPVYNKSLDVKKPASANSAPVNNYINPNSPFVPAEGLSLPIRLGRVSSSDTPERRITAVLCPGASNEKVFYAESEFTNLNDAIKNLREREGISPSNYRSIGYVNVHDNKQRAKMESVAEKVNAWAIENGYDAVVWTDLPTKGIEFGNYSTGREVIPALMKDPVLLKNTQDYIRQLPTPPNSLQRDILAMSAPPGIDEDSYQASLTADFAERDGMPQTNTPKSDWFKPSWGTWGPYAKKFPAPKIPDGVDPIKWKQDRIIEVAKHYKGLPYKR